MYSISAKWLRRDPSLRKSDIRDPRPFCLVIAGPNGSGKTTLTKYLRESGVDWGHYINPDDIALEMKGAPAELAASAQAEADRLRRKCLDAHESVSFETVMSHPSKIAVMEEARLRGFTATLFFVGTSDPEINVSRVSNRVALGGHDVPADRIRARYHRLGQHRQGCARWPK